jgi:helicase required for RNAi-mediated heterochromatin assembly 1
MLPPKLNPRILEYYRPSDVQGSPWLLKPEFPSSAEVTDAPDDDQDSHASSDIVELEANRPRGAWHSKEEYLQTQYELYREDALRGIREAVTTIKSSPHAVEDDLGGRTGIYEKVQDLSAHVHENH